MKNKKTLILIIVIAVLVIAVAVLLILLLKPKAPANTGSNGVSGEITDNWDSGIDHGSVTPGIQIPGFKDAKMKEGDETLHLNIGNPEENDAGFLVTVKLEDGTVLYESPVLKPGQGISELPLLTSPKKGTYTAYVEYQVVTLDEEHTPMNTARTVFTLYVE